MDGGVGLGVRGCILSMAYLFIESPWGKEAFLFVCMYVCVVI